MNVQPENGDDASTVIETQYVDYPNLKTLTNSSDSVVVGKVVEIKGTHGHAAAENIPVTDFAVTVDLALKGSLQRGDTITVQQLGGNNAIAEADRLMKVGEEYVLFLGYTPDMQVYTALGGPQGKFMIQNQKVYSMDNFDPEASFVNTKVKDRAISDFLSEVSAAVAEVKG